jgi:hypothetical protein
VSFLLLLDLEELLCGSFLRVEEGSLILGLKSERIIISC